MTETIQIPAMIVEFTDGSSKRIYKIEGDKFSFKPNDTLQVYTPDGIIIYERRNVKAIYVNG